jgi:hypothetical protein
MIRASVPIAIFLTIVSSAATAQTKKANATKGKRPDPGQPILLTRIHPLDLLLEPSIREELELTPAQESRIGECKEKLDRNTRDLQREFEELGEDPDEQVLAAFREHQQSARRAVEEETESSLLKALDRRQRTRLDQIGLQKEGPRAFFRSEIQERLNMDDGQIAAIKIIVIQGSLASNRARKAPLNAQPIRTTPGESPNTVIIDSRDVEKFAKAQEKSLNAAAKVRESTMREIARLLTKKQRQAYQTLCGEPFDVLAAERRKRGLDGKPGDEPKAPKAPKAP